MGRELPTNLVWRGRKIYLRTRIPDDVRHAFGGKPEVWRSLGTSDEKAGKRLGRQKLAELEVDWQRIRDTIPPPAPARELTTADIERNAAALYEAELGRDEEQRLRYSAAGDIEAERLKHRREPSDDPMVSQDRALDLLVMRGSAAYDRDGRGRLLAELKRHLGSGETTLVHWAADAAIIRDGLKVDRGSVPYRRLCQGLARAWIQALERSLERDQGDFTGRPSDAIVLPAPEPAPSVATAPPSASPAPKGETIIELFDKYAATNPNNIKADTLDYSRNSVLLFTQTLPAGSGASAISKKAVREWHDLLRKLPIRATDFTAFRGLDIHQVIEANKKVEKPLINRRTQNKHVTALASFCRWLEKRGHIDANPVTGFHEALDHTSRQIRPFTIPELQQLFDSAVFTGYRSETRDYVAGDLRADDWRKWLPLMGLFTGARLGELCQLATDDIRKEGDHWIIRITAEGDGKSLKNKQSERIVPVHAELIRLGLLEYRDRVREKRATRLFPDLEADTRGFHSGKPSRWFGKYAAHIGLKVDKLVNFHSFRHGMTDALRRAGYLDTEIAILLGHKSQGTKITRGYGAMGEGTLARRVEMMSKVEFSGLILCK